MAAIRSRRYSIRKAKPPHSSALILISAIVHAGAAASWDNPHERFEVTRINHQEAYRLDGACADMAEEYFSRLRAEVVIQPPIAGAYLLRHAQESSWREDNRRVSGGDQVSARNQREARLPTTVVHGSAVPLVSIKLPKRE